MESKSTGGPSMLQLSSASVGSLLVWNHSSELTSFSTATRWRSEEKKWIRKIKWRRELKWRRKNKWRRKKMEKEKED